MGFRSDPNQDTTSDSPTCLGNVGRKVRVDRAWPIERNGFGEAEEFLDLLPHPTDLFAAAVEILLLVPDCAVPRLEADLPGRRPYAYVMSRRGRRYLEWLPNALLDSFQEFVAPGPLEGKVLAGDRLLRRLRAYERDSGHRTMFDVLEVQLDALLRTPSPQVFTTVVGLFAGECLLAIIGAPFGIFVRGMRILQPFLGTPNAQSTTPGHIVFHLSNVPVTGPDGKPVLNGNGAPVTRDVPVSLPAAEVIERLRQNQPRFELDLTPIVGHRVTLDLSSFMPKSGVQVPPKRKADP